MKIKFNFTLILIIFCIFLTVSTVSASQADGDNDYQVNIEMDQYSDLDTISDDSLKSNLESNNLSADGLKSDSKSNNLKDGFEETYGNFTQFHDDLLASEGEFNLSHGYAFHEGDSKESGTFILEKLVINGNGNVIDGLGSDFTFNFHQKRNYDDLNGYGSDSDKIYSLTINNLTFKNFNGKLLGFYLNELILNNVTFTNFTDSKHAVIGMMDYINLTINNCNFYSNTILEFLNGPMERLIINNSNFFQNNCTNTAILMNRGQLIVENSSFENISGMQGSIIDYKGDYFALKNSKFINSHSNLSGGAILAKYFPLSDEMSEFDGETEFYHSEDMLIENCSFSNLSSTNNGGAIHLDLDSASEHIAQTLIVRNSNFTDCSSKFGGAISILGGCLNISNSNFKNNNASFEGGAIYSSWTNASIVDTKFTNNRGSKNAGAYYFDKGKLEINASSFIDNEVIEESNNTANAIYAHDVSAYFANSIFNNGGVSVYADFASDSKMENVLKNDDIFLMDNHDYIVSIENPGIKLNLTGNEINVDTLPSRFDARDYGWTTPGKVQGDNTDCWAFASIASMETSLGKSTGVLYNLSQNYLQKLQLKYFESGDLRNSLTGFSYSGLGYALSWYGVLPIDNDYDPRGMIADTDMDVERIHVQDALFIPTGMDDTVELIKTAIMKYGAVTVQIGVNGPYSELDTDGEDIAIMSHGTHFISLIGWDDNYYHEFSDDPHEKFTWFTKDSLTGFSDYPYSNFPDADNYAIDPQRVAIAYIFENAIDYHVNYQTDLTGLAGFNDNYYAYSNEFTSKYDEMIGAVGTYFNESGIDYSFDVFVNDQKIYSQNGESEFAGYRTIPLDKYVPIKTGDKFKVVFKSNAVPYQGWSRVHYLNGTSLVSYDGESWTDFALLNKTVCLKVYTLEVDDTSFTALQKDISQAGEELNITHDYIYNKSMDSYNLLDESNKGVILIEKEKFVLNGNNHIFDGAGIGAEFRFSSDAKEIVINDLTFRNFNEGIVFYAGKITLNNVNFTGFNNVSDILSLSSSNFTANNCHFHSNPASGNLYAYFSEINIINSSFLGNNDGGGAIQINRGQLFIHNSSLENFTSKMGSMISYKGDRFELINTSFINGYSTLSGGAILAKYFPIRDDDDLYIPSGPMLIKDCIFANVSCGNDGGAIHIDLDSSSQHIPKTLNIVSTNFTDCSSKYGGVISILGGRLNISNSNLINSYASFKGGAIYSSWTNLTISQSNITNNSASKNAGAIFFDKGNLTIAESNFIGNKILKESSNAANTIYAHDVSLDFSNSTFDNGGVSVYADFASDSKIENVDKNDDIFLLDNHDYICSVENKGIKLNFTNNEIVVDTLPPHFDARDWGWTTPGKVQGDNDDCWAFATIASIETSLLKSTGVAYNLSQNYVQKLQLKYSEVGDLRNSLTGFAYSGLGYALSWYGVLPTDAEYDDRGMIADSDMDLERIHVQDAMFIYTGMNDTVDQLKRAILKYGAVTVQYWVMGPYEEIPTEGDDIALMEHGTHFISLIGWDDNYSDDDETSTEYWITKDSLYGFSTTEYSNFPNVDYYAIDPQRVAIAYIFENANDYHVNYQTDLTGLAGFNSNYTIYSNEFTSKYDELIGAVGTYFNESGINYSFDVFVNDKKVHTQNGVSEFAGYRTIDLDKSIPIRTGDKFKVVFKSNAVPYQGWSRVHYQNGTSLVSQDGSNWIDFAPLNKTVCLKVYTLEVNDTTFTALAKEISQAEEELNLTHDYIYNESIDSYLVYDEYGMNAISIVKNKFVINGNNHVIDGAGLGVGFEFMDENKEIILNDLTFKNFNKNILLFRGKITFNNVNFTGFNNLSEKIVILSRANFTANNCHFYSNHAELALFTSSSELNIINSSFLGNNDDGKALELNRGQLFIHNSSFENFTSNMGSMIGYKGDLFELVNTSFINGYSTLSGGAIIAKYFPIKEEDDDSYLPTASMLIKDCIFTNVSCGNDGGAIHIDLDSSSEHIPKTLNIVGTNFTDTESKFGGVISILGGRLNISNSNFINSHASFKGGAIYSSWTNLSISQSNFTNNSAIKNAGAIFFDKGKLTIAGSNFIGNKVLEESANAANTIYAHDVSLDLSDSTFDNGGISVYADFASDSKIENVEKNDDIFLLDNHDYICSVENKGIRLNFTNNEIVVDSLPSHFDARDWGWTTPGKVQGDNDDCWAFATIATIETSLLKSTGVAYNLSQNYVQKLQLKYYESGDLRNSLTGFSYSGLGYALSWYGVLPTDAEYDDRGMIADSDMDLERIHVQDAMFIYTGMNDTIDQLKRAILKYGAVTVQYWVYGPDEEIPTEGDDIALMSHTTHFISLIGWDDDYYNIYEGTYGCWITKDSLFGFGNGSYTNFPNEDKYAIAPQRAAIAYIFENGNDYHVNYQTDLTGLAGFDENYTIYSNEFTSKYDELIGAVGTYFNESGIEYSFDVFVNGAKVHTQTGISEYAGFRTIVLDKYIPIKTGDIFKVVFKSNAVPYQAWSRVHYQNGTSLVSQDGSNWIDFAPLNKTVCLKVYTVEDDTKIVNNKDISVDYSGGSYFSVKVVTDDGRAVGAGKSVKFTINGKNATVKTDANGIAKLKITQLPGKYTITTTYRGKTYKNTVTVKQVLKTVKASVKNTDNKLILKATLTINGKAVKGKVIKFTFRGKTYSAKTNANGIAQVTIKQGVIKTLTGNSYAVKVTYLADTVKTTVTVKQVLKANNLIIKKTAKSFTLKASLKINGKVAKGKVIKFTFRGKTYSAKTNSKGIAIVTIKKAVIQRLYKGKTYAVKVAYGKDYVKTTVKVKK